MGKLISSPINFGELDVQARAKNWRETDGGSWVRKGNSVEAVRSVCSSFNRIEGRYPRPWFWMAQPVLSPTTTDAEAAGSDPLYLTRIYDGVTNARDWTCRIVAVPRLTGAADCYASLYGYSSTTGTPFQNKLLTALDLAEDGFADEFSYERGARALDEIEVGFSTHSGYTALDVVFADDSLRWLEDGVHDCVDPASVWQGGNVLAGLAEDMRAGLHDWRQHNLPVAIQWHAQCIGGSWATPVATGPTGIVIAGTDWLNICDTSEQFGGAPHSRGAQTPGVLVPGYLAAKGREVSVKVTVRVLAQAVTNEGQIQFEGPDHVASNTCTLTWPAGAGVHWQGTNADYVRLNAEVEDTDETTRRNKIDIFGKLGGAGGALYVYAIVAWIVFS